jgi:TonB family protein
MRLANFASLIAAIALCIALGTLDKNVHAQNSQYDTSQHTEKPKGEVDLLLDDLRKHNQPVVKQCLENCHESTVKDGTKANIAEIINKVQPEYPPIARAAHATGEVVVMIIIDEEGTVIAAQVVSGHPLLQAAAATAARESTFKPTLIKGQPVKVQGTITYNFKLQ